MNSLEDAVREQLRTEADRAPDAAWMRQRLYAEINEIDTAPRRGALLAPVAAAAGVVAIAGAAIYFANGTLSTDDTAPVGEGTGRSESQCLVDRAPDTSTSWLNSTATQNDVESVNSVLRTHYGYGSDAVAGLGDGLIGVAIDGVDRRIVVVVDPTALDQQQLESRLASATDEHLMVSVAAGCHTAADLIDARNIVDSEAGGVNIELSPYDSTWHVRISPDERSLGERLVSQTDGLVSVEYAQIPGGVRQ